MHTLTLTISDLARPVSLLYADEENIIANIRLESTFGIVITQHPLPAGYWKIYRPWAKPPNIMSPKGSLLPYIEL